MTAPDRSEIAQLFETRVRRLTTAGFLADPALVEMIAPMMRAHLQSEIASLRERLRVSAVPAVNFVATRPRIALTNFSLKQFGGSELWTADVARYLVRLGLPTLIYTPVLGSVSEALRAEGIKVTDDAAALARFMPTIVLVNHHAHCAPALAALQPRPVIVNTIHGLLPAAEAPGLTDVDAYLSVALHATAKTRLMTGLDWDAIRLVPNFFDPSRFRRRTPHGRRGKALLFSSKSTPEQRERLGAILARAGYTLDHTGLNGGIPNARPENILPNYDLVFAVARSAIEALAAGCRVILCDAGLIGPAVTQEIAWTCVAANFSLLGCVLPWVSLEDPDADAWVLQNVASEDRAGVEFARTHLSLDRIGELILAECARAMASRT